MRHRLPPAAALLVLALLTAVSAAAAAPAAGGPKLQITAKGQADARAASIIRDDVGRKASWIGGPFTPNADSSADCPAFHPKRSDLVLNGLAGVSYEDRASGISLRSQTAVFATAGMSQLLWKRSLRAPKLLPCVARRTAATLQPTLRFVSIKPLVFPEVVPLTTAWRITLAERTSGRRYILDQVAFARGRTEVSLATSYYLSNAGTVRPAEIRLAKALAGRIRA